MFLMSHCKADEQAVLLVSAQTNDEKLEKGKPFFFHFHIFIEEQKL